MSSFKENVIVVMLNSEVSLVTSWNVVFVGQTGGKLFVNIHHCY